MKKSGNRMLITGGTSGIGLGLARRFHATGNKVIVAGRRQHLLDEIAGKYDGIEAVALDVSDPDSIGAAFRTVTASNPDLNVLVNVAGIMLAENLGDAESLAVAEETVTTNLLGPIRMINAFLPILRRQKNATIVNVSSGLAFVPLPMTPTYCATKAAIHSYSETLRVQLADSGIQVVELIPPAVRTTLMEEHQSDRSMPLEDFLDETLDILWTQPDATQICVERVKAQRFAEATGNYDKALAMMSGRYDVSSER